MSEPRHPARVLLVDDDIELGTLLKEYLVDEGFDVLTAQDGRAALMLIETGTIDIVVLDIMMPRMNGIETLQRIRRLRDIPVIMLTAKGDDADRIAGLNLGADDYVPKPSSPGELAARLTAVLRRAGRTTGAAPETVFAGDLVMHPASRKVDWRGSPLELTGTEFSILEVLARHAGQLVSKQELSQRALGRALTPFDRRIDVHISSVRQKLGSRPDGQSWIQSVRGLGYQLLRDR
ncbi:two-component system, OmpR family, response regulator CpxR [Kaistia soli DSM 19436]|uniref:Two-component system, OmpR family, response regulator CpxR n=1 Tax=Kaistia soli DSM 19436 TaxID=1122133 RepID=A0A1M5KH35_9HYPH|nr:response regulator [Kaistia soli]SHG52156.1 two-component system, OmpR family, response regulator CpxR [Kaistia soli DSM 19436]